MAMQAKQTAIYIYMDEVTMDTTDMRDFRKAEDVWRQKQAPVAHLVLDWQPTTLACEVNNFDQPDSFSLIENPL